MLTLLVGITVVVADQVLKYLVRARMTFGQSVKIVPQYVDLTYVRNTGAAWGIFGGRNAPLTLLSLVLLGLMLAFRRSLLNDTVAHRLALGLMCGGIIGNVIDRLRLGWVTDFLDLHFGSLHWPAFNIADAAICSGVGIYILTTWSAAMQKRMHQTGEADKVRSSNVDVA